METDRNGRPIYGGKFAKFHEQIALHNSSEAVSNADIIAQATETREDFNNRYDAVVASLTQEYDPGKKV